MSEWLSIAGLSFVTWAVSLLNLLTWRRGARSDHPLPRVSVLIPARNEERNIQTAIKSVLAQEWRGESLVQEVVVYDDGSTDATARLVDALSTMDSRVRLVRGGPLPDGWIGKPHACHQLSLEAQGDLFLFMDADVRFQAGGMERLLSLRTRTHLITRRVARCGSNKQHRAVEQTAGFGSADARLTPPRVSGGGALCGCEMCTSPARGQVVSAVPAQICGSFIERLIMPLLTLTYTSWLPLRLIEWGRDPRTVAANGQILLMTRDDYACAGGFRAVRNEVVDDVAFCKRAKTRGLRVVFADGSQMASCRMYRSGRETIAGFSKNLHEGLGGTGALAAACGLYLGAFVVPYVAVFLALLLPQNLGAWLAPALVGVALNITLRAALALRFGHPWEGLILHPFAVIGLCGIAINSWRWHQRGIIHWAGREYRPRGERESDSSPDTLRTGRLPGGAST